MINPEVEIASYTYKPGVVLAVIPTEADMPISPVQLPVPPGFTWTLVIVGEVLDSRGSGSTLPTRAAFRIPDDQLEDSDTFANLVRLCMIYWETHEVDEWLRRENVRVFTPSHHGSGALSSVQTDIYDRLRRPRMPPRHV